MSGGAVRSGERTRWRNGAGVQLVADHLVGSSGVTDDGPVTVDRVLGPVRA
jgi:hypothetical protein